MREETVTREHAEKYCMPEDHTVGIVSEGAKGYWGTGNNVEEAVADARRPEHGGEAFTTDGCWVEIAADTSPLTCD